MEKTNGTHIFRAQTVKPVESFVGDLAREAGRRGFLIHNEEKMYVKEMFASHGYPMPEGFDLHLIQICNPAKASKSMAKNPERAAVIPKFITSFTRDGVTQIRLLKLSGELLGGLLDDAEFGVSVEESYRVIEEIIEAAR